MTYPDRPDVPRRPPYPLTGWEPRTEEMRAVPGYQNWTSGPMTPDGRALSAEAVARAFDVPPHLIDGQLAAAGRCDFDQRTVVTKDRRETRHGLHLLLTFCTFGLWALTGWPIAWLWNRFGPRRKTVTYTR